MRLIIGFNTALIEHVPSRGWQIRLANGMFLVTYIDHTKMSEQVYGESNIPHYYPTKEITEHNLADYLRSLT